MKTILSILALTASTAFANTATFEDITVPAGGFLNGGPVTNTGNFVSAGVGFQNNYSSNFGGFWSGFAVSNVSAPTTPGFGNQYASRAIGSGNYAIAYGDSNTLITLPPGRSPSSVSLTNTAYAFYSMQNGDSFAKKFGGASGNDADFFAVTFTGYANSLGTGSPTGSLQFFLADYRFADNAQDYLLSTWQTVNLAPLGSASSVRLSFQSSDVGTFGINTPTYVALDNLATIPEPASLSILALAALALRRR
jgi:hypothetical protein